MKKKILDIDDIPVTEVESLPCERSSFNIDPIDKIRIEGDDVLPNQRLRLHNLEYVTPIRTYHRKTGELFAILCHKTEGFGIYSLTRYRLDQFTVCPKIEVGA